MTTSPKLEGRVAIVTGAGGKPSPTGAFGTGKAIAALLAREGARVAVVDRHQDRADETRREIESAGGEAVVITAELVDQASCRAVVDRVVDAFDRVDILINNAAAFYLKGMLETTPDEYEQSMITNVTVPFMLSQAAIPVMVKGGGGSIVNISSIAAMRQGAPIAYAISKGAMQTMTMSIASEFGPQGIRTNCVVVGAVDTPLRRASVPGEYQVRRTMLPTEGDAWDIARATIFLAGPDASHITGVLLPVDGGVTMMSA